MDYLTLLLSNAVITRHRVISNVGVLAFTGLSGILGTQIDFPPPHHIYTINENKIEEILKSLKESLYIKIASV